MIEKITLTVLVISGFSLVISGFSYFALLVLEENKNSNELADTVFLAVFALSLTSAPFLLVASIWLG